jgi:S1-C subfamily serine protease
VVVGADGRILTKLSELHGNLSCRVRDGAKYAATIIKSSKDNDLALIKIEPKAPLTSLSLDTSILERFAHIAAVLPTGKRPWNRGMSPMDDSPIIGIVTEAAQRIAPIAGSLGLFSDDPNGVRLTGRVVRTVGLELNDVVQSINGKPTPNLKAFEKVMHPIPESVIGYAGDKVSVRFVRGEKTLEKECILVETPRESLCEESPRRSGFTRAYDSDLEIYQAECGAPVMDADGNWIGIAIATRGTGYVYVLNSIAIQAFLAPSK